MAIVWTPTANPTFRAHNSSDAQTFSSVAIGDAAADRYVIVFVIWSYDAPATTTGVTIAGSNATQLVTTTKASGTSGIAMWGRLVTTGTTADIVVTPQGWNAVLGIQVGIFTGANTTPTGTQLKQVSSVDDPQSLAGSLTIPTGGYGLVAISQQSGFDKTITWSDATEDYDQFLNPQEMSSAHHSTAGTWSPTASGCSFSATSMVAATFEPAAATGPSPGSIVPTITL